MFRTHLRTPSCFPSFFDPPTRKTLKCLRLHHPTSPITTHQVPTITHQLPTIAHYQLPKQLCLPQSQYLQHFHHHSTRTLLQYYTDHISTNQTNTQKNIPFPSTPPYSSTIHARILNQLPILKNQSIFTYIFVQTLNIYRSNPSLRPPSTKLPRNRTHSMNNTDTCKQPLPQTPPTQPNNKIHISPYLLKTIISPIGINTGANPQSVTRPSIIIRAPRTTQYIYLTPPPS